MITDNNRSPRRGASVRLEDHCQEQALACVDGRRACPAIDLTSCRRHLRMGDENSLTKVQNVAEDSSAICWRWFARNVHQVCDGGLSRRTMYFATDA